MQPLILPPGKPMLLPMPQPEQSRPSQNDAPEINSGASFDGAFTDPAFS